MLNGSPVWKTIQICMVGKLKSIVHLKQSKVAVFWELTLDYTVKHHWISEKGFSAGNSSWPTYLFSPSVWIEPLDNSRIRKWLVQKFCFSRANSSGCVMISEALNNSKTVPMSCTYPSWELEKWSSESRVNGSTKQDKAIKPYLSNQNPVGYSPKSQNTWRNTISINT